MTNLPHIKDYGIDLIVEKEGERIGVQAKYYQKGNKVGSPEVQQALGSIFYYDASKVILVTTSDFTNPAYDQTRNAPIELWNYIKLKKELSTFLPSDLTMDNLPLLTKLQEQESLEIVKKCLFISKDKVETHLRVRMNIVENKNDFFLDIPLQTMPFFETIYESELKSISNYSIKMHLSSFLWKIQKNELLALLDTHSHLLSNKIENSQNAFSVFPDIE